MDLYFDYEKHQVFEQREQNSRDLDQVADIQTGLRTRLRVSAAALT